MKSTIIRGMLAVAAGGWMVASAMAVVEPVTLSVATNVTLHAGHTFTLPLDGYDPDGQPLTFSVISNSLPGLTATLVTTNRTLCLNVSVPSTNDTPTTGDLKLELFEHLAPRTTARLISLVQSNFYNGLIFHRIIQDFMAQGGDPLGTGYGVSGVTFDDEFVAGLTFEGFGQLAMANSGFLTSGVLGRDNNDSQFFITAPNLALDGVAPPTHLNYRHTIFGQLTQGFDLFRELMAVPVNTNSAPLSNVVINTATIITNRQAAVLYLTAPTNLTGTATMTVQAQSINGTAQATFQVNIITNTLHDPPYFNPMPATLLTTQNVAVTIPFTWHGGSDVGFGLWDADTGSQMTTVKADFDATGTNVILRPSSNYIGRIHMLFCVYDTYDHNGDGQTGVDFDIQEFDSQRILMNVVQPNLGAAVNLPGTLWSSGDSQGGSATWYRQTSVTHDGSAALQSGRLGTVTGTNSIYSWTEISTNGPGSILFWWRASTGTNATLGFYVNGTLKSSITGNSGWQQYAAYISTTGTVTLTWAYLKGAGANGGADAGWLDEVTWIPSPYAEHVPQLFFQNSSGLLASWVLNSTGGFEFARILANTGGWALKAAGDIDGDGVSDLLFQTPASDTGGWFMNADGTYRDARFWWNTGGWEIKACADYEGTGRAQLFFQTSSGLVAYWRLETNGVFQSAVVLGNMGAWKLRGGGDIDGDSKAELFWQNAAGSVAVWYHNPDGSINSVVPFATGDWALRGVTDVDHDGVSDLLWQTPDLRTGGWFMNADGTFRDARFWWPTIGWQLKAAGR